MRKWRMSLYCVAACLMLIPMTGNCIPEKFQKQKKILENLHRTDKNTVQRETKKLVLKIKKKQLKKNDSLGNIKHLVQELAICYKNNSNKNELVRNKGTDLIGTLIGKKYSNLQDDLNNEIGTLLWLEQKKRKSLVENCLNNYLSNPLIFAQTAANIFFVTTGNKVFL